MPAGGLFFYSFGEVRRPANEAVASALMTPAAEKDPRGFWLARISPSECESNAPARLYDEASLPETRFRLGLFAGESSEIPISTEKSLTALLCDADDSFITIRIADADV